MKNGGSRRIQLVFSMVAMSICIVVAACILSGDGASKLLNYQASVSIRNSLADYSSNITKREKASILDKTRNFSAVAVLSQKSSVVIHSGTSPLYQLTDNDPPGNSHESVYPNRGDIARLLSEESPTWPLKNYYEFNATTTRISFAAAIVSFLFFYWGGIGLLSWILIAESFPMRFRAKGTITVAIISDFIGAMVLTVIKPPTFVPVQARIKVVPNMVAGTGYKGSSYSPTAAVCIDEWVRNVGHLSPSTLLFIAALFLILMTIYFFLSLPETGGKYAESIFLKGCSNVVVETSSSGVLLTEMNDLFDVNDFDVCFGCCPHGRVSGFLGALLC